MFPAGVHPTCIYMYSASGDDMKWTFIIHVDGVQSSVAVESRRNVKIKTGRVFHGARGVFLALCDLPTCLVIVARSIHVHVVLGI